MQNITKNDKATKTIEDAMWKAHIDTGAQTREDFYREGFSDEEINIGFPGVARRIREAETASAGATSTATRDAA